MYLKSLEINGFKSFAKKGNLEFTSPITAIVGPNGSGKSNVAEAFRFVLGEQSIKSMRGKKGEDLIFNGGKTLGKMNRANVKLVFENSRRILNVDFDEVSIERIVHRDGVNEYYLNGTQVRLRDVMELLAGAHIGSSGHHIISQGEADKILNANLKERREMIEDALGLKIYHYKREESLKKLDKTKDNIKEVQSLRREIAPHIKFLEKQVEKVEKARQMREDLRSYYKEYLKREEIYLSNEKRKLELDRKIPVERKQALELELREARKTIESSAGKDQKSEELLSLESELGKIRSDKDSSMREIGRIEGSITSLERTIAREEERMHSDDNKMVALKDVEGLSKQLEETVTRAEQENDISILKGFVRSIRELITGFISKNRTVVDTSLLDGMRAEISTLAEEKRSTSKRLEELQMRELELNASYNALKEAIEKEKDSNREAEKTVFRIMAEQNEVNAILNAISARAERLALIEEDFRRELKEAGILIGRDIVQYAAYQIVGDANIELTNEEILSEDRSVQEERRRKIEKVKIRLEDAGVGSGEDVLNEYKEAEERDRFLAKEVEDLERTAESLTELIAELEAKLTEEFKTGVSKINTQFQEFFSLMFGGGKASLDVVKEKKRRRTLSDELMEHSDGTEMEDEEDGDEGIDIQVALPHKKIKGLMMLSGGERALTSIALLFAISQVNPPPFIILDETDAALDEANSRKYGDMIENLSKYSQLILITHNRETMSRAGVLYGVTMSAEGYSTLVSIHFEDALKVAK